MESEDFEPGPEESEHFFQCPWCWQQISMLVEPTDRAQEYVEDCEVCCRPIRLRVEPGGEVGADADRD